MKKIYLLILIMFSTISFGQASDLIISEYGEGTVGNSKYVELFNNTGADVNLANYRIWTITNGGTWPEGFIALTGTLTNGATFVVANNTTDVPGANLYNTSITWNGDDAVGLAKDIAGTYTLIDAVGTDGVDPGTGWNVAGTTNATANFKLNRKPSVCNPNTNWTASAGTNTSDSEWIVTAYTTGAAEVGHTSCSSAPTISITSPANSTIFSPETTNVNVALSVSNFNVANGTGDGHIRYTINGGAGVMKYDTTPIAVPTTPGAYAVYVELVDNSNVAIVPAKNATVNFTVANYTNAATLAAVRAAGINAWVNYTGTAIVSFSRPAGTGRNQKYIQDATAGILVDDPTASGGPFITTPFIIGDGISNIKGQLINFNGVMELVPNQNATKPSTGNTITPQVVSLATIAGNIDTYESQLVQINNVSFTAADGSALFALNSPTPINDGVAMNFTPIFPATEVDYIGSVIPTGSRNILVLVSETTGNVARVVARSLAELTLSRNSFDAIAGLRVYPNPANTVLNITSDSFATKNVEIYNVVGAKVLATTVTNAPVNVAGLTTGIYMVKVTEEGKTATRKLVIE